jgi:hypothetical protein
VRVEVRDGEKNRGDTLFSFLVQARATAAMSSTAAAASARPTLGLARRKRVRTPVCEHLLKSVTKFPLTSFPPSPFHNCAG